MHGMMGDDEDKVKKEDIVKDDKTCHMCWEESRLALSFSIYL